MNESISASSSINCLLIKTSQGLDRPGVCISIEGEEKEGCGQIVVFPLVIVRTNLICSCWRKEGDWLSLNHGIYCADLFQPWLIEMNALSCS